jgi:hypothetical protein
MGVADAVADLSSLAADAAYVAHIVLPPVTKEFSSDLFLSLTCDMD